MATRKEIEDQIAALQAEADQMGEEDEFDVEIWNEKGEGARLPHGQTTRWLRSKFPELFEPDQPDPDADADNQDANGKGNTAKSGSKSRRTVAPTGSAGASTAQRYFGKRPAGK